MPFVRLFVHEPLQGAIVQISTVFRVKITDILFCTHQLFIPQTVRTTIVKPDRALTGAGACLRADICCRKRFRDWQRFLFSMKQFHCIHLFRCMPEKSGIRLISCADFCT